MRALFLSGTLYVLSVMALAGLPACLGGGEILDGGGEMGCVECKEVREFSILLGMKKVGMDLRWLFALCMVQ